MADKKSGLSRDIEKLIQLAEGETFEPGIFALRGARMSLDEVAKDEIRSWEGEDYSAPLAPLAERGLALEAMAKAMLRSKLEQLCRAVMHDFGSPIEELFFYGLVFAAWREGMDVEIETPHSQSVRLSIDHNYELLRVTPQAKVDNYRVDFRIEARFGPLVGTNDIASAVVAVELDGHDFHEKTKQQVRRDKQRERHIAGTGLPVVRFAGSEVFESPYDRAEWLLAHIKHLAHRPAYERLFRKGGQAEIDYRASFATGRRVRGTVEIETGWTLEEWAKRMGLNPPKRRDE